MASVEGALNSTRWLSARLRCPSASTPFAWLCELRCSTTYGDWCFVVVGKPNWDNV